MRILHVASAFWPAVRYGGPIVSVRRLCAAVQAQGVDIDVVTTDIDGEGRLDVPTDRWTEVEGLKVRYFRRIGTTNYCLSPDLWRFLRERAAEYDLVHVTGTFTFPVLAGGWAARRARKPYVVSPRGNLQAWSMRQKRWKKLPYWYALERPHLRGAASIHATADIEAEAVAALLPGKPVAVVPNGMDPVTVPAVRRRSRQVVFLGRVHRKKGLDILVEAVARLRERWPDLETVIAGPDDDGEWERIRARIDVLRLQQNVKYIGSLNGEAKFRLLAESTVFVLPSHSENFGQAVVEALACGTPVVVSRNCPWKSVADEGAGYWVENGVSEVANAIEAVVADPSAQIRMGEAARRLAGRFTWESVGRAMVKHYGELLGGPAPGAAGEAGMGAR